MNESKGLSNYQIAEIYGSMISGDKSALFKLQQISSKNYMPKYMESYYHKKEKYNHIDLNNINEEGSKVSLSESKLEQKEVKQVSSVPSMQMSKEQMFLNILKKGSKLEANPANDKQRVQSKNFRRLVNSSNNRIYELQQKTEVSKQKNLLKQIKQNLSNEVDFKISIDKSMTRNRPYVLPKVHKTKDPVELAKVQSTHMQSAKKDKPLESLQKSKITVKRQKVDFKEIIGKNKKLRQDFQKKNLQEKEMQLEIMEYHNETKDFLQNMKSKYDINLNNRAKYLKRKTKVINDQNQSGQLKESHSQKKISPFKMAMKNEAEKCIEIENQLSHLKSLLAKNASSLQRLEKESQEYLFTRYLNRYGMEIQEELDEEGDTVQPLQQYEGDKNRYKYSMARTREKKWSLIQRTEYEAQRTTLDQSRKANTTSRTTEQTEMKNTESQQSSNKVTVNERLKNLLFS